MTNPEGEGAEPVVILIADDERVVQQLVRAALEPEGYTFLVANNGNDVLRICSERSEPLHLAILDIVMPGVTGFDLVAFIRQKFPRIRMLFTSGYSRDEAYDRAGLAPEDGDFIAKPFTLPEVRRKVKEELALGRSSTAGAA